ncbi:unnamed protein product [Kuraishia capsulata CBS 1993]|uniref:Uncharacterized protein n=1 Tax=Kuraishia capsulata CBS 1993 TaxID=1382522 RepID=W6MNN7_9ASCO|nr:unnamed protein product [Kuraishia capsulata CBS 1993]
MSAIPKRRQDVRSGDRS